MDISKKLLDWIESSPNWEKEAPPQPGELEGEIKKIREFRKSVLQAAEKISVGRRKLIKGPPVA